MKLRTFFLLIWVIVYSHLTFAQVVYDYGFQKTDTIQVTDSLGNSFQMPWAGGMNSVQFSEIDLNLDGILDLFAFDKAGYKIMTFINQGSPNQTDYVFDDSYRRYFPEFYGWVHLLDYNNDQKMDIFAYTSTGIMVYKNGSDTSLKFQLLYPTINSDMGSSTSNISVTYDDYPAFYDIDNDGDIDILAFFGLGTYIQMHKNLSQELYGNSDTLIYKLTQYCWGNIAESPYSNHIYLNITCPWRGDSIPLTKATRHTGSTMLPGDFNGDTLADLILGDVDYFNLTKLTNGGTLDSAHITTADTLFPSLSNPINFNSFPVASLADVNNDGLKDLLVSPFSSVNTLPENLKSVWYYKNTGNASIPQFTFIQPDFLQKDMIEFGSGAYPVIYDVNSDGLPDIMVGNYGYLDSSYYEFGNLKSKMRSQLALMINTGTLTNPSFHITTKDYANLSQLKLQALYPTFGDLDNDGDIDMLCGQANGSVIYFENTAGVGNLPVYAAPIFNYQGIDVGDFSAPQLFDMNNDSLIDLVVGKKSGYLTYYQNTGTAINPVFTKITDTLGKVCVIDPMVSYTGFSTPCFFKDSNQIKLFVGSDNGYIYYYKDIEANLAGKFTAVDSVLISIYSDSSTYLIKDGVRTGVAAADFDNDGYIDMVLGNFAGGLTYYKGVKAKNYNGIDESTSNESFTFSLYPNPVSDKLNITVNGNINSQIKIEIYDVVGRKVVEKEFRNASNLTMDIRPYRPGFYMCRVMSLNRSGLWSSAGTKKFIISR